MVTVMRGQNHDVLQSGEGVIDLIGLIAVLKRRIAWLIAVPVLLAGGAYGASFLTKPLYRSEALLLAQQPGAQQGLLNSVAGQFGGLAALAGVDLGGQNNKYEAMEVLRSRSLTEEFIRDRSLLPVLFEEKWDAAGQKWLATAGSIPSMRDGIREMDGKIRGVSEDRRTGLVTLSVIWRDPAVAAEWANDLVRRANDRMRKEEITRAERVVEYLKKLAATEESVAVRTALFNVIEGQYKTIALSSAREDFAFKVIDPAVPPDIDEIYKPRRVVCGALGGLLGLLAVFMLSVLQTRRESLWKADSIAD